MNIEKGLEHFKWKFDNVWTPTKKDLEAYNAILDWKELQESKALNENESLAKLWIHQLMLLNQSNLYTAERAIQVIDEILEQSVYDWVLKLKDRTNIMRFNAFLKEKGIKTLADDLNVTKAQQSVLELACKHQKEADKILNSEISEENIIRFVENHISRIM